MAEQRTVAELERERGARPAEGEAIATLITGAVIVEGVANTRTAASCALSHTPLHELHEDYTCLLYTSDAADE